MVNWPCPTRRWVTTRVPHGLSWELFCLTCLSVIQRRGRRTRTSRLQMTPRGSVGSLKGWPAIQGELEQGEKEADRDTTKFSIGRGQALTHECRALQGCRLGQQGWGTALGEMEPGPGRQWDELGLGHLLRSKPAWIILWTYGHVLWFDPTWLLLCSLLLSAFIYVLAGYTLICSSWLLCRNLFMCKTFPVFQ